MRRFRDSDPVKPLLCEEGLEDFRGPQPCPIVDDTIDLIDSP